MKEKLHCLFHCCVVLVLCMASAEAAPLYPFPHHTVYSANSIKPDHRSQEQLDADVAAFYEQWKQDYLVHEGDLDGHPLYRINAPTDKIADRTVSEGQGYGMVIVALMAGYDGDAQAIFDGLWRFSRQHPSIIDSRLMDWRWLKVNDKPDDSAFDGDADIAYALLLADKQWGSLGAVDYAAEARTVLDGILESTIGADSHLPLLGDWVNPGGRKFNQYTPRVSDFMPSHFRSFARFTGNPAWGQVVSASQALVDTLQSKYAANTGLVPDFVKKLRPAPAHFLESANDGKYFYNAGRFPWRIGVDVLLNNDATSRQEAGLLSKWIESSTKGDPYAIRAGYKLNGKPVHKPKKDYFTTFFAAPFGVAAMSNPEQQAWLNAVYSAVYNTHENYYEDSVTLLCLLIMSGNYWVPEL